MKHTTSDYKGAPLATSFASRVSDFLDNLDDMYVYIGIALLGLVVYARTLFFDFTYFDDNVLVLTNLAFLQDPRNIFTAFTVEVFHILHSSAAYYRPLLTISFVPDAILSGATPGMYHLTNIIIHLVASSLVYVFLRTLGYTKQIAIVFSCIFVVHPVLTQAVAWIPGRNDSLLAVWVLSSFVTAVQYMRAKRLRYLALSTLAFACALFTKETALILPILVLTYFVAKRLWDRNRALHLLMGFAAGGTLWGVLRHLALKNPLPMTTIDMVQSVIHNSPASIQLLGKVFFPFNLSVLPIIQDTTFVWGILATFLLLGLLVWRFVRPDRRSYAHMTMMLFGALWFLAFLFPSFIRPNPTIVADFIEHRLYLPIIGIFILLIESEIGVRWKAQKSGWFAIVGIVIVIFFGTLTFVHSANFADRLTFWKNAAEMSPHSPLSQRNLGAMYYLEKDYDRAKRYYERSLELNVNEQMAHGNLGLIYMGRGEWKKAEEELKKELAVNPYYDNAHFSLGLLYYRLGRTDEAVRLWKRTLEINPDYTDATHALEVVSQNTK